MPNIGAYHPIIVHFAIALVILGVIFRWVSLTGRAPFTGPAAETVMILLAATDGLVSHAGTCLQETEGTIAVVHPPDRSRGAAEQHGRWRVDPERGKQSSIPLS